MAHEYAEELDEDMSMSEDEQVEEIGDRSEEQISDEELVGEELHTDEDEDEDTEEILPPALQKITASIGVSCEDDPEIENDATDDDYDDSDEDSDDDDEPEDDGDGESAAGTRGDPTSSARADAGNRPAAQDLGMPTVSWKATSKAKISVDQVYAAVEGRQRGRSRGVANGPKRRRRGRTKIKGGLPPAVAKLLGEANMCYVSQDFAEAIRLLEEVVRRAPKVSDPYHTLGLVYEEMGDDKRALESYLVAAYLTGRDADTWKRVANMSQQQGLFEQALYCTNRALRLTPGDTTTQYTRAVLLVQVRSAPQIDSCKCGTCAIRRLS
jgi:general transcription factor 3C polypeptide 3 (transcription factor C subunit 4)